MGGFIRLSDKTIKAREEADKIRNSKTLEQVITEIKQARKERERLIIKNWFKKP